MRGWPLLVAQQGMNAAAFRQKYNQICPECGSNDFVDDHSQGDLICKVWQPSRCHAAEWRIEQHGLQLSCRPTIGFFGNMLCAHQGLCTAQECGLVLESHAIDTRSEWRTFGDSVCLGAPTLLARTEAAPAASACCAAHAARSCRAMCSRAGM